MFNGDTRVNTSHSQKQRALDVIQETSARQIVSLLSRGTDGSVKRGFDLLNEIVQDTIWAQIQKNPEPFREARFTLFNEIYNDVLRALQLPMLSLEYMRRALSLVRLIPALEKIALVMGSPIADRQANYLSDFLRSIGKCLANRGPDETVKEWGDLFNDISGLMGICTMKDISQDQDMEENYLKHAASFLFDYYYGLLMNQVSAPIVEGFYCNFVKVIGVHESGAEGTRERQFRQRVFLALAAHSFLFHITRSGPKDVVDPRVRKTAEGILNDAKVKDAYSEFLKRLRRHSNVLDEKFSQTLQFFLGRYEEKNSTKDFFLCVAVYVAKSKFIDDVARDTLTRSLDILGYQKYAIDAEQEKTRKLFAEFLTIIDQAAYPEDQTILTDNDQTRSVTSIDEQARVLFDFFVSWIKNRIKDKEIRSAQEAQKRYKGNEAVLLEKLKKKTEDCVKKDFAPIMKPLRKEDQILSKRLDEDILVIHSVTELMDKPDSLEGLMPTASVNLFHRIGDLLELSKAVELMGRNDIESDRSYVNFLKSRNIQVLMGSPYLIMNKEYSQMRQFQDFLEGKDVSNIYGSWKLLALMGNSVELRNPEITVDIQSPSWEEIKGGNVGSGEIRREEAQDGTECYSYQCSREEGISTDYTEDELRQYLSNKYKTVRIHFKGEFRYRAGTVGVLMV